MLLYFFNYSSLVFKEHRWFILFLSWIYLYNVFKLCISLILKIYSSFSFLLLVACRICDYRFHILPLSHMFCKICILLKSFKKKCCLVKMCKIEQLLCLIAYRSFIWVVKIYFYYYFKLSPSCLSNFIWRFCYYSIWIRIALMKFKMYFLYVKWHIFIVIRFDIYNPLMCVSIFFSLLTKVASYISIDYRFNYSNSLEKYNRIIFPGIKKNTWPKITEPILHN